MERRSSQDHRSTHNVIEDDTHNRGNLIHLLQSHDQTLDIENTEEGSSINLDTASYQRDRAMTIGSFRDRAFTLGSEFDLRTEPGFDDSLLMTGNPNLDHITPSGTVISISSSNSLYKPCNNPIFNDIAQSSNDKMMASATIHSLLDAYQRMHSSSDPTVSQDRVQNPLLISHTPTSEFTNSYELNHFGKRMRSGTMSGRCRAMSDLDIDGHQKGILKDLNISGDDSLQKALDQYERGDTTQLELMIKSGVLNNKLNSDIDILGDLDLDFLTVQEDTIGGCIPINISSKSAPISIKRNHDRQPNSELGVEHSWGSRDILSSYNHGIPNFSDDGIGDLEFNADYAGAAEPDDYLRMMGGSLQSQAPLSTTAVHNFTLSRTELTDTFRYRSNSLAFGGILDEPVSDDDHTPVGRWMDRTITTEIPHTDSSKPLKKRISAGLQSSEYTTSSIPQKYDQDPQIKANEIITSRATMVAERKRQRQEKKESKEREKEEKKVQKEKEIRAKKEKEELDKRERRELKASITKSKQTEKKKSYTRPPVIEDESASEEIECEEATSTIIASGSGRPRSLNDPILSVSIDEHGLLHVVGPADWVGAYSPDSRKLRVERFLAKRDKRVWIKKVKYDVRKNFADSRLRVKGRFVKKEDELLMRDLISLT